MTTLASHYCFLLYENLAELTNHCYNPVYGAHTTITYPQAEYNIIMTLERRVMLLIHDRSVQHLQKYTHQHMLI